MPQKTKLSLLIFFAATLGTLGFIMYEKNEKAKQFDEFGIAIEATVVGHTTYRPNDSKASNHSASYFVSVEYTPRDEANSVVTSILTSKARHDSLDVGDKVQIKYIKKNIKSALGGSPDGYNAVFVN
ncbi:MAG: hypothetical protein CMH26_02230 [Micavibrio sp.]|nr:hypothetical protein [Micavibrio sp.]|tara:strand:- start:173 stop:553 length:381 start_codon:yes stop_codon:yes gene_type:complete